jgi:hypothetical protein
MKRWITLALAIALAIIASKLLIENVLGIPMEAQASRWLTHAGLGTAALIAALLAADVALPIPSSLVMVLSGAAFGVWWGSLVALVGSIAGEWVGFELVRRYGRGVCCAGRRRRDREAQRDLRSPAPSRSSSRAPSRYKTMSVVAGCRGCPATFLRPHSREPPHRDHLRLRRRGVARSRQRHSRRDHPVCRRRLRLGVSAGADEQDPARRRDCIFCCAAIVSM